MVFAKVAREDQEAFEEAYRQVANNQPDRKGHVAEELLRRSVPPDGDDEPLSYILTSEWEDLDDFLTWEVEPIHREAATPMRPFWSGKAGPAERIVYDVVYVVRPK
jgi:heme-degrading monooxygenase HmoA